MKKIRILVISPYEGMEEIIYDLISRRNDLEADCYVADMDEAVSLIKELDLRNYDVVLSRGGTANRIKAACHLPVIDVGLSTLDALRAIRLAQNFDMELAVVGFENITRQAQILNEVLQYEIPVFNISSAEEAFEQLKKLKNEGFQIIVCDVVTSQMALKLNLNPVLATTGYESIQNAIDQAVYLTSQYLQKRQELLHLTMMSSCNPVSCIIFDDQGNVILSTLGNTPQDQQIFQYLKENYISIRDEESKLTERKIRNLIVSLTKKHIQTKASSYLYLYIQINEKIAKRKFQAIRQMTAAEQPNELDAAYYNSSYSPGNTQELIEKFSKSTTSVIITGETGTGKDQTAFFLYSHGPFRNAIYYSIDCNTVSEKEWNYLLTHHESPFSYSRHTIYFRHANALSEHNFQQLLSYLSDTNLAKRNRLIFSFVTDRKSDTPSPHLKKLRRAIASLTIYLPSLRERSSDIPVLSALYINRMNVSMGKQIIGFETRALQLLQSFPWEMNLDQFQHIIRELMLITTTSYISYENTMRLLRQETSIWKTSDNFSYQFDLSQTLDQITYDVVRQILKQENNNHTKTAKHLGISRSTLWRILKMHENKSE